MAGTWFSREQNKGEVDGRQTYDYNEYLRWGGPSLDAPSGGSGGYTAPPEIKISDKDLALLKELDLSKLKFSDFEAEALKELTPYYERLLAESNWDVQQAKNRIIQDYQTGLRQQAEDLKTSLKELIQTTIPKEQKAQLEELNKRGMLGTILNQGAQARSQTVNQVTDVGQAVATNVPGQAVTTAYNPATTTTEIANVSQGPVTTAQFGGLAGKQWAESETGRDARQEAITRAFTRYNEEKNLERSRGITDAETTRGRQERAYQQEKAERIPQLAGEKYARKVQEMQTKRQAILEPYHLKVSNITGLQY